MYFGVGIKNKIKELRAKGKHDEVKRELLKIRMSRYEKLNIQERLDIDYYLAWYSISEGDKRELLDEYLNSLGRTFESVNKDDYRVDYYRYLWLKVSANYKDMSREDVTDKMLEVHEFYKEIGDFTLALTAITSIHGMYYEGDKVLDSLKNIMGSNHVLDEVFLNSFLGSLTDISQELYIEAKSLIKNYIEQGKLAYRL